jgi:nucleoside-triphosphatase THEP1
VVEMYLYYRLRMYASLNGGSFQGFNFSKTEKYDVLPKIQKLGWVNGFNVVKYRKILNRYSCRNIYFNLEESNLLDINSFKAVLIATTEKYLLDVKQSIVDNKRIKRDSLGKKTKVNWDKLRGTSKALLKTTKKIDNFGNKTVSGRAFNSEISRIMKISQSTITRWRKESKDRSLNHYLVTDVTYTNSLNRINKMVFDERVKRGSVFKSKQNTMKTRDLYITSSIDLFKIKSKIK